MLVHKSTLGILDWIWDGRYEIVEGISKPYYARANLENLELSEEDYWVVKDPGLCLRLKMYYPFFDPVIDDNGELIGITPWPKWKIYNEPNPEEGTEDKSKKKKKKYKRIKFNMAKFGE